MSFRNLSRFPHILKILCLIFLLLLLFILWENRQYPSTKLTSWQVLPLLIAISVTIWANESVHEPEWAYLEVIACSIMTTMSFLNCISIWQLEPIDFNTYFAYSISTLLTMIWFLQLTCFGFAACFDFWDFAKAERAIEEGNKKPIRSLSAQFSGAFFVEVEELPDETYRDYRNETPFEEIEER
ncbi:unnamed protein product, partial [Mesorhabditis belari]|uniref:Uncharacterized protein n=1 Tax=Mesorhabditis belari TaxID=2138241 RepID=A0AAF3EZL5_9BILA